jgi:hypothetical protein
MACRRVILKAEQADPLVSKHVGHDRDHFALVGDPPSVSGLECRPVRYLRA